MKCPKCDVDLKSTGLGKHGTAVVDVCPDCRGAWFDEGELGLLEENMWADAGKPPAVKCPRCGGNAEPLPASDTGELVVERCTSCKGLCLGVRRVYG